MAAHIALHDRKLWALAAAAAAAAVALPTACGSTGRISDADGGSNGSGTDGGSIDASLGSDASADAGDSADAGPGVSCPTINYVVTDACVPQLQSSSGCGCGWSIVLPCSSPPVADASGDASTGLGACVSCAMFQDAGLLIDQGISNCDLPVPPDGGGGVVQCRSDFGSCIGGRPPRGFTPSTPRARTSTGARLACMAQVEAASVPAFHGLAADLARHGAPRALLSAVRRAARDEVRHARAVGRLARRLGASVPRTRVPAFVPRSLVQVAVDNAEEGCVKETFGAVMTLVQAASAADAGVRRVMRALAKDELEHAALAWRIARWLDARLDVHGRAQVATARRAAVDALARDVARDCGDIMLGVPSSQRALAGLDVMRGALNDGQLG